MPGCYVAFHKQLGDLVLLEPTLTKLREHHGAPVCVMTRSGHAPLLELMPGIRYQRPFPVRPRSDVYCFDATKKSMLQTLSAHVKRRHVILPEAEECRWYHALWSGRRKRPDLGSDYVAEYFWSQAPVPADVSFRKPILQEPPDNWTVPEIERRPFVLLNPTSGWPKKSWITERWIELIHRLHDDAGYYFVLTSENSNWQTAACSEIANYCPGLVGNLSGQTSLRQFVWLCSRASLTVTVDGAASHLSQAFGVPTIVLFGPTNRRNWHQEDGSSLYVEACTADSGKMPMRNITVEAVENAVHQITRQSQDSPTKIPAFMKTLIAIIATLITVGLLSSCEDLAEGAIVDPHPRTALLEASYAGNNATEGSPSHQTFADE